MINNTVYLIIGSNVGNREYYLSNALNLISTCIGVIETQSGVYETEAWGIKNNTAYLNQCIKVNTSLNAINTLKQCLQIETKLGRIRSTERYAARIIDIDILLFNSDIIKQPNLEIPHPRIQERNFVLIPLCEIAANLIHPVYSCTFYELLNKCTDTLKVNRIEPKNMKYAQ